MFDATLFNHNDDTSLLALRQFPPALTDSCQAWGAEQWGAGEGGRGGRNSQKYPLESVYMLDMRTLTH